MNFSIFTEFRFRLRLRIHLKWIKISFKFYTNWFFCWCGFISLVTISKFTSQTYSLKKHTNFQVSSFNPPKHWNNEQKFSVICLLHLKVTHALRHRDASTFWLWEAWGPLGVLLPGQGENLSWSSVRWDTRIGENRDIFTSDHRTLRTRFVCKKDCWATFKTKMSSFSWNPRDSYD